MKRLSSFKKLEENTIIIGFPEKEEVSDLNFRLYSESLNHLDELNYSPSESKCVKEIPEKAENIIYFINDYYPLGLLKNQMNQVKKKLVEKGRGYFLFESINRSKRMEEYLTHLFNNCEKFKYFQRRGLVTEKMDGELYEDEKIRRRVKTEVKEEELSYLSEEGLFSHGELDEGTRFLLESINVQGRRLLDVGCGPGPIGLYYADNFEEVTMIDENRRATRLAKINTKECDNITVYQKNKIGEVNEEYDYILSNPPTHLQKRRIIKLFKQGKKLLRDDGKVYLVVNKITTYEEGLKKCFKVSTHSENSQYKILELE